MPRPKPRNPLVTPRMLGFVAALALGIFLIGEAVRFVRSDTGRLAIARATGMGAAADLNRIISKHVRLGLGAVAVPRDSIREAAVESGPAPLRWRVGLHPDASLLQTNYAVTRALEERGAVVMSATERAGDDGTQTVRMLVGLPRRPTHELLLVRDARASQDPGGEPARLAVVLYGFGDDAAQADSFFTLPLPFAVAVLPGLRGSERVMAKARARERELVLHLPLEPINYPRLNPGPGTLLVSMKPSRIASQTRRYLRHAGPVAAVANHMGSLATQDMTLMRAVYGELKRARIPFLHVDPAPGAVCKPLAADMGIVYAGCDALLDREPREDDPRVLDKRWTAVLREARDRGRLVVLVRATPLTRDWLKKALAAKRLDGVQVVPLAALIGRPASAL